MPARAPSAHVVLVHGYAEHCGRYGRIARTFVDRGAAVYAYDQRGYGRSGGRRAYVDHFDQYLRDLSLVCNNVPSSTPDVPLFVFGHSMGGLVALLYVVNNAPSLQGLLLSAPAIEINPDLAPVLRKIAHILSRVAPTLPTVRSPQGAISRDPAVVQAAQDDPLNYHGRTLARTGAEMLRAGTEMQHRLHEVEVPFLVLHGTDDVLASPRWSKRLHERAESDDKTLRLYDGLYHETFNEPEKDQVLDDVGTWFSDRMPTGPAQ